jgi:Protein of unknown function (DUF2950)
MRHRSNAIQVIEGQVPTGPGSHYFRHDGTPIAPVQLTDAAGCPRRGGSPAAIDLVRRLHDRRHLGKPVFAPGAATGCRGRRHLCNMDGIVYERDFGPGTDKAVASITAYDPGPGWSKAKP